MNNRAIVDCEVDIIFTSLKTGQHHSICYSSFKSTQTCQSSLRPATDVLLARAPSFISLQTVQTFSV